MGSEMCIRDSPQVEKLVEKSRSDGHADMYQMRHALYAEWVVDEARHNIDLRARYLEIAEFFRRRFDGKRERAQDLIQYVNYLYRSGDKNAFISGSYLASPLLHQWALYESVLDVSDMQLQIRNRKAEGTAFGNIGLVNAARGNNEAALKCQMEGLAIAREIGDRVDEARALVGIADTQLKAGDPQEALSNLEQSLEIFTETSDHEGMVTAMYNIARIAYEGGQFQSATKLLRRTAAICRKNNNHVVESAVLNTMAAILFRLGKDDEALVDFLKSLSICQRTGHVAGEAVTRRNIARIYEKRGMFIEAVEMVEITVTIDRETRHPDLESDSAYLAQLRAKLKQE